MPTAAYASAPETTPGKAPCAIRPKAPPSIAPMKTAGKKLPPGEPVPSVNEVAIILQARASASVPSASSPASAAFIDSMPVPRTRGAISATRPTANPPSAALITGGTRRRDSRSSAPWTQAM